jgi:hypothetical protein
MILNAPYDKKLQYELVNDKPHFGIYVGTSIISDRYVLINLDEMKKEEEKFSSIFKHYESKGFQIRDKQWISNNTGLTNDPLIQKVTVGCKFIVWGRAFKVMRLFKSGKTRYKKKIIAGRRKKIRVKHG